MISIPRLTKLAAEASYERLMDEVTRNGRPLPLAVRLRLTDPGSLAPAALGLALQRVVELTYRPTPASRDLLARLLGHQGADGGFGAGEASVSSTAVALSALLGVASQINVLPRAALELWMSAEEKAALDQAIGAGLHFLSMAQESGEGGALLREPGLIGDEIDSAVVLWQLGLQPRFARAVRFEALLTAVDAHGLRHRACTGPLLRQIEMCWIAA